MIQDPVILFLNDLLSYDIYEQFKFNVYFYIWEEIGPWLMCQYNIHFTKHKSSQQMEGLA